MDVESPTLPAMRRLALVMACLPTAGCSFAPSADAIPGVDSADSCMTFSSQTDTCGLPLVGDITISGARCWNTDSHELLDATCGGVPESLAHRVVTGATGELDVLLGASITIATGARLRVVGSRPFGMIALASITIDGF